MTIPQYFSLFCTSYCFKSFKTNCTLNTMLCVEKNCLNSHCHHNVIWQLSPTKPPAFIVQNILDVSFEKL